MLSRRPHGYNVSGLASSISASVTEALHGLRNGSEDIHGDRFALLHVLDTFGIDQLVQMLSRPRSKDPVAVACRAA